MSDFSVGIRIAADAGSLSSELRQSEARLNEFRNAAENAGKKMVGAFDGAQRGITQVGTAVAGLSRSVIGIGTAFAGAFVGGLAVGAFVDGLKSAIDAAGELVDTADQLGVTIETLQELRFAASQSGVGAAELDQALLKLQTRIGEFNRGDEAAIAAFTRLGLAGQLASGQLTNAGDTFEAVAGRIAAMANQADAAAATADLFGERFGPKLLNVLRQGSDGIDDLRDKARELGIVMSDETARAAEDAGDKLEQLSFVLKAKVTGAFVELAPEVGALADALIAALPAVLDWVDAWSRWLAGMEQRPERALQAVTEEIARLQEYLESPISFGERGNIQARIDELEKEKARLEAEIAERRRQRTQISPGERDGGPKPGEVTPPTAPQPFVPVPAAKDDQAGLRAADQWLRAAERAAEEQVRLAEQAERERQRIDQQRLAAIEKQQREEILAARESFREQVAQAEAYGEFLQQQYEEERRLREEAMATDPYAGLLAGLADYAREATALGDQIRDSVMDAFQGAEDALVEFVTTGKLSIVDLARTIEEDLARTAIRSLITGPLAKSLFNSLGGASYQPEPTASAKGNAFVGGAIVPFAAGGIVDRPTLFPMATGGAGLMGEAGAEAIMPLRRDASGRLGVAASGSGGDVAVTVIDQRGAGSPPVEITRRGSSRELQILLKGQMEQALGGGDLDRIMASRFGLRPSAR